MECAVVREEPVQLGSGGRLFCEARRAANLGLDNRWMQLKREAVHAMVLKAARRLLVGPPPSE